MTFEQQRTYIMDTLDWKRLLQIMIALNWTWAGHIPTTDDMKSTVEGLLTMVHHAIVESEGNSWSVATGGFEASAFRDKEGIVRYSVAFSPIHVSAPVWEG